MSSIFISHSSANNAEALALREWLVDYGLGSFLDIDPKRGLIAGDRWRKALVDAGGRAKAVLFIITPEWLASKECYAEFAFAAGTEKPLLGVIGVDTELSAIPSEMTSQWQLSNLTKGSEFEIFRVKAPPDYLATEIRFSKEGLESLRQGLLRQGLGSLETKSFSWPAAGFETEMDGSPRSPWRGLQALDEPEAGVFFGRDGDLHRAMDALGDLRSGDGSTLLVILGASGSGKSSFLRAGLLPRLRRLDRGYHVLPIVRPEAAVINGSHGLLSSIERGLRAVEVAVERATLRKELETDTGALSRRLYEIQNAAAKAGQEEVKAPTLVLPLDQAEELFLPGATETEAFIDALCETLRYGPETIAIATIRTETYGPLQSSEPLRDLQITFSLPPINQGDYRAAIEGPAERLRESGRDLIVVPTLIDTLVAEARGADALPLLAFTLERLYRDYGGDDKLDDDDYVALGGMQGAVEAAVDAAFTHPEHIPSVPVDPGERLELLRRSFPWLVRLDEASDAALRRVAPWESIPADARNLIERLINQRLLRSDVDESDQRIVEIAHEALLRQWPTLRGWLDQETDNLRVVQAVERATSEWQVNDQAQAWLDHVAERLTTAEALAAERPDLCSRWGDADRKYLGACRAAENAAIEAERQQYNTLKRRLRIAVSSAAAAAVLGATAIVLGVLASQARTDAEDKAREARYSLSRTLSVLAKQTGSQYPQQGLRLSLDALAVNLDRDEAPSLDAQGALRWTLANAGGRPYTGHDATVSVTVSNDDRWVATFTGTAVQLWKDPISAADGVPLNLAGAAGPARFSPDGRWLITGSTDAEAGLLWDLNLDDSASARPKVLEGLSGGVFPSWLDHEANAISVVDIGPAGRWLVIGTAGGDGASFRAWDLHAREPGSESIDLGFVGHDFSGSGEWKPYAVFSGDGRWLVLGAWNRSANRGQTMDPQLFRIANRDPFAAEPLVLSGHKSSVSSLVFSPDSALLATSSNEYDGHTFRYDTTVRVWDLGSASPQTDPRVLDGHTGPIEALAFSPDGRWVVSGRGSSSSGNDVNSSVRIWDLQEDDPVSDHIVLSGIEGVVTSLIVGKNPGYNDSQWLAVVSGSTAKLWNFGRITATTRNAGGDKRDPMTPLLLRGAGAGLPLEIRSASASRDHRWLITGSGDFSARVWDLTANDPTRMPRVFRGHEGAVDSVGISVGAQFAVTGSEDRTARLWSLATRAGSANPIVFWGGEIHFSPDGRWLVSGSRLWNLTTNDPVALPRILRTGRPFLISPDSRWLVGATSRSPSRKPSVLVWDLADSSKTPIELPAGDEVFAIAMSGDSRWIAAGMFRGEIRLWDMHDLIGNPDAAPIVLPDHADRIFALSFSPDHRWLVSVDSKVRTLLWDLTTGAVPSAQPLDGARPLVFSPQGRWLATSGGEFVRVWDLKQPIPARSIDLEGHEGTIKSVAFSADERWLVTTARESPARLWDFGSDDPANEPIVLPVSGARTGFSSNGRWLVTGHAMGTQLWGMSSIRTRADPTELEGRLETISSDGRFAVTKVTGDSGSAISRLWDLTAADPSVPTPSMVPVIWEMPQAPSAESVSPDGRWLVTSTNRPSNKEYQIWNMHLGELQQIALRTMGRDLRTRE